MNWMPKGQLTIHGLLLTLLLILFGWGFVHLSWDLHDGMRTHKADLGQVAQAVWHSGQGRFVAMTDNGPLSSRLTDHVEPILAIISPILWLWRDVKALLLLQVMAVVVGGWLLYQSALEHFQRLLSPKEQSQIWLVEPLRFLTTPVALALVLAFLLSPQIQNALLTEFHAAPLAVPLILWAFYAVEKLAAPTQCANRSYWIQFIVATILTALVKEEMALLAAGLALWPIYRLTISDLGLAIRRRLQAQSSHSDSQPPNTGHHSRTLTLLIPLALALLCVVWFYLTTFVIVPAHAVEVYENAENPYWARYGTLGNSPLDIVKSLFTQPGLVFQILAEPARANYLWTLVATFGFLCLLAPEILVLSLPLLLANVLSAYPPQYYGEFHYSAPLVAYFGVSAIYGVGRLGRLIMRLTAGASPSFQQMPAAASWVMAAVAMVRNSSTSIRPLLFGALTLWIAGWGIGSYLAEGRGPLGGRYDPVEITAHHRLLDRFVAQIPWDAAVTATAAVHPHVALRERVYQFPIGMPEFDEQGDADWALLDVTTNTDMAPGDLHARVMSMLAADWGVIDGADGFLLLKQGAEGKQIPDAFYDFARAPLTNDPLSNEAQSNEAQSNEAQSNIPILELNEITTQDRPRWRSTQIEAAWRVGSGFDPAVDAPKLAIHTPSGEHLYSYSDGTPTALIWYPPERWQPNTLVKISTPTLVLPKAWGVVVNAATVPPNALEISDGVMTLAASYFRNSKNELVAIPLPQAQAVAEQFWTPLRSESSDGIHAVANLRLNDMQGSTDLFITSQLSPVEGWPGRAINLQMHWDIETLDRAQWKEWTPFVHLRGGEESAVNLAQQDGAPRWFLLYNQESWFDAGVPLWDWRQLVIPPESSSASNRVDLVVGLYNPASGERAIVLDGDGNIKGNEVNVGELPMVAPPEPDFACAMIGSCAAQPID